MTNLLTNLLKLCENKNFQTFNFIFKSQKHTSHHKHNYKILADTGCRGLFLFSFGHKSLSNFLWERAENSPKSFKSWWANMLFKPFFAVIL